jgi:NAD(P)-dependent dehydrogenase (short-subunit alcohol dehydrogenase family)
MTPSKICLITGANSGIGKVAAIEIAMTGARIVMVCRNLSKAEKAREEIVKNAGNDQVDILICDFSSMDQIRATASAFLDTYPHLDILLNNAGYIADQYEVTEQGIEKTFAVNHLGYFLLTGLLLPALQAAPSARIVNVASEAHRMGKFQTDDLSAKRNYSNWGAYALSKLCNIMFTHELAKKLKGSQITTNSLHPGFVKSNFGQNMSGPAAWLFKLISPLAISNEEGAATSVYLATSPEVGKISGKYWDKKKIKQPASTATNDALTAKLWEVSNQVCGLTEANWQPTAQSQGN